MCGFSWKSSWDRWRLLLSPNNQTFEITMNKPHIFWSFFFERFFIILLFFMVKLSPWSNAHNISDQHYQSTNYDMFFPLHSVHGTNWVLFHPTMYLCVLITTQVIICLLQYTIDIVYQYISYHIQLIFWFINSFTFGGVVLVVTQIHNILYLQPSCWSHVLVNHIIIITIILPLTVYGTIFVTPNSIYQYNTIKLASLWA